MLKKIITTIAIIFAIGGGATSLSSSSFAAASEYKVHKIVLQIDDNDAKRMNLVLNNAANMDAYYKSQGEESIIEIVAYGPGLTMLIANKSPVKARIKSFGQNYDNISFKACNNTLKKMERKSGKTITLLPEAQMVPAGVIHMVQREEEGWSYIRP